MNIWEYNISEICKNTIVGEKYPNTIEMMGREHSSNREETTKRIIVGNVHSKRIVNWKNLSDINDTHLVRAFQTVLPKRKKREKKWSAFSPRQAGAGVLNEGRVTEETDSGKWTLVNGWVLFDQIQLFNSVS